MKECPLCKRELEEHLSACPHDGPALLSHVEVDPFIGAIFGRYRIEEKIGEGVTGKVYRATDILINIDVAIKIFHSHLMSSPTAFERFRREALAAIQIRHPNAVVVKGFGVARVENVVYMVMEFLEGENLRDRIRRRQLDDKETIKIFRQVCSAVNAAHTKGITHCNLKPGNIRILKTEEVRVLDFCITNLKVGSENDALTKHGVIAGNPDYMSPEQIRGEELGSGSDVYSLGIILYEMLTGHVPFHGSTPTATVLKHITEMPKPLSEWRPDIPDQVEKVVLRALEKKPEDRQQSAIELTEEFEKAFNKETKTIESEKLQSISVINNTQNEAHHEWYDILNPLTYNIESDPTNRPPQSAESTSRGSSKAVESPKPHSVEDLKRMVERIPSQAHTTRGATEPATTSDMVDCTVFAPPTVPRGEVFMVQVFTHLPEQAEFAARLAHEFDDEAERRAVKSLEVKVERDSKLTFHITMPGLDVDEPVQHLIWRGSPTSVQFGVTVPQTFKPGVVVGTLTVSQNTVPIGHLKFKVTVAAARKQGDSELSPTGVEARLYKKVFVSYASQDRREVLKRVQMLSHLHINFFQDVLDFEPGVRWEKELYRHIDESDLFLLFWSSAAKQSKWVMKEIQYALNRKGGDDLSPPEILPVPIEGPPQPAPPEELSHLHFGDYFLYFLSGS